MPTFKVGDVVRRTDRGLHVMPLGHTGKVIHVTDSGRYIVLDSKGGAWVASRFSLVNDQEFEGNT